MKTKDSITAASRPGSLPRGVLPIAAVVAVGVATMGVACHLIVPLDAQKQWGRRGVHAEGVTTVSSLLYLQTQHSFSPPITLCEAWMAHHTHLDIW